MGRSPARGLNTSTLSVRRRSVVVPSPMAKWKMVTLKGRAKIPRQRDGKENVRKRERMFLKYDSGNPWSRARAIDKASRILTC